VGVEPTVADLQSAALATWLQRPKVFGNLGELLGWVKGSWRRYLRLFGTSTFNHRKCLADRAFGARLADAPAFVLVRSSLCVSLR
jgi:hypothetical protein